MATEHPPFGFDTRTLQKSLNENENMQYLETFLCTFRLQKYRDFFNNLTYKQLHVIPNNFWDTLDEEEEAEANQTESTVQPPTEGEYHFSFFWIFDITLCAKYLVKKSQV